MRSEAITCRRIWTNLDSTVELAIGVKVVTACSVQTETDLANGARDQIMDIVLHSDEPTIDASAREVQLAYPLAYVQVRFAIDGDRQSDIGWLNLPVLERGFFLTVPHISIRTSTANGNKQLMKLKQKPLQAAYAIIWQNCARVPSRPSTLT